ncbi:DNA methylase N-4/N-6 domain protein [Caldicellulosiruptor kronotskyensis 2002]|uniref:Methyltransferase n=1 Tax=Caldicellulosiruptor kronotskyensis (strain DSM 18902 / VKM B-2412 / 2002) TaxID=632348 RepID=E4SHW6_CALK2|nr:DNA methylase N-4/N-6 domain protein [Caldicellulosiruptor kronotskyensis 2002]
MKYLKKENALEKRIRLDEKIIRAIENLALKKGESFSLIVNKILEEYLKNNEIFPSLNEFYAEEPNLKFDFENKIKIFENDFLTVDLSPWRGKINLIVTSPPYNVGIDYNSHDDSSSYEDYLEFSRKWLTKAYDLLADDGRMCLNIPLDKNKNGLRSVYADIVTIAKEVGFKYQSTIIWNEQNISRRTAWGSWLSASAPYVIAPVETIVLLYKHQWKRKSKGTSTIEKEQFIEWTNGVWTFNGENRKKIGHPAPFPVELPRRCIKLFSFEEDTVLDPFLGSGSTLIAALEEGRQGIGVEIDSSYVELAIKRIMENFKKQIEFQI